MIWWSLGLSVAGMINSFVVINKRPIAWMVGAILEVAWFVYAIASNQWPFMVSAVFFLGRDFYGYTRWRRDDTEKCNCVHQCILEGSIR